MVIQESLVKLGINVSKMKSCAVKFKTLSENSKQQTRFNKAFGLADM